MRAGRRVWIAVLLIVVGIVGVFVAASMLTVWRAFGEREAHETVAAVMEVPGTQVLRSQGNEWTVYDQHGAVLAVVTWSPWRKLPSSIEYPQAALPPVASLTAADIQGPALALVRRWYPYASGPPAQTMTMRTSGRVLAAFAFRVHPDSAALTWAHVYVDSTTKRIVSVWSPGRGAGSRFITSLRMERGPRQLDSPSSPPVDSQRDPR